LRKDERFYLLREQQQQQQRRRRQQAELAAEWLSGLHSWLRNYYRWEGRSLGVIPSAYHSPLSSLFFYFKLVLFLFFMGWF